MVNTQKKCHFIKNLPSLFDLAIVRPEGQGELNKEYVLEPNSWGRAEDTGAPPWICWADKLFCRFWETGRPTTYKKIMVSLFPHNFSLIRKKSINNYIKLKNHLISLNYMTKTLNVLLKRLVLL